jgi:hypothetical protein
LFWDENGKQLRVGSSRSNTKPRFYREKRERNIRQRPLKGISIWPVSYLPISLFLDRNAEFRKDTFNI